MIYSLYSTPFNNTFHVSRITAQEIASFHFSQNLIFQFIFCEHVSQPTHQCLNPSQQHQEQRQAQAAAQVRTVFSFLLSIYPCLFFLSSNNLSDPTIQLLLFIYSSLTAAPAMQYRHTPARQHLCVGTPGFYAFQISAIVQKHPRHRQRKRNCSIALLHRHPKMKIRIIALHNKVLSKDDV